MIATFLTRVHTGVEKWGGNIGGSRGGLLGGGKNRLVTKLTKCWSWGSGWIRSRMWARGGRIRRRRRRPGFNFLEIFPNFSQVLEEASGRVCHRRGRTCRRNEASIRGPVGTGRNGFVGPDRCLHNKEIVILSVIFGHLKQWKFAQWRTTKVAKVDSIFMQILNRAKVANSPTIRSHWLC